MVIAFCVIIFLILMLVFVVHRNQGIQQEVKQGQSAHNVLKSQNKHSANIVVMLSSQLQQTLHTKLVSLERHGLINQADFEAADFVVKNYKNVIILCSLENETVETSLIKLLQDSDLTMEKIHQFIARQPSDIRVAWSQNTIEGFVIACNIMTSDNVKSTKKD